MQDAVAVPTPTRGVRVQLDRPRHLRYTLAAVRRIRDEFGHEALEQGKVDANEIGKLLWYGLTHEDPDLTVEQLEDMIDMENLPEMMDALTRALGLGKAQMAEQAPTPTTSQ